MTPEILAWLQLAKVVAPVGDVLEVGSYDVNGSARSVFEPDATSYIGTDLSPGPGVDLVLAGDKVADHFSCKFDTVICCECLEHCLQPWLVVDAMKQVLKPSGMLWVSTPTFGFPEHRYPIDCYRFGEDAYRGWLFADMQLVGLTQVWNYKHEPCLVACGRNLASAPGRPCN